MTEFLIACLRNLDNKLVTEGHHRASQRTLEHMDSDLYYAIIRDDNHVLREIEGRLSVCNQRTPTNCTVLHVACQYRSIKCVKEILSVHKSLLLETNSKDETALHLAARQGHYEVVVALIEAAKSSPMQLNCFQNTSFTAVQILIRTTNVELETALHMAVQYNHLKIVQLLVTEDPSHPHCQNKHNETPLYLASIRYYTDIICTILDNCKFGDDDEGPAFHAMFDGPDGRTALHAAVLDDGGRDVLNISECVKLLLDKNKDLLKVPDEYGWTAFHYVAYNNLHTIVDDLVGEDKFVAYLPDKKDKRTALHVAAYKGNIWVMKKLVEYFPDCWEIVDGKGQNILHIAVEQDQKEVIRYILSQGCKAYNNLLIQRDKQGNTPLHLIAKLGCYVEELMNQRALDWEVPNSESQTPLDLIHWGNDTDTLINQVDTLSDQGKETDTLANQAMIKKTLINAKVQKHWHLWRTLKEPDVEMQNRVAIQDEKNMQEVKEYKKMVSTHMIVAALITTVALTAGFTMPGGFDANEGPTKGSAILLKKTTFKGFIVTDTLALLFSISSLSLYFMATLRNDVGVVRKFFFTSVLLNTASIITMMIAFITGTYSVLDNSSATAISVSVISSFFLLLAYFVFSRMLIAYTLLPHSV